MRGNILFNAETQRTQRKRREDEKEQGLFSLRFLCVLCVSALKKRHPLVIAHLPGGR